jgi:hypothetical protein
VNIVFLHIDSLDIKRSAPYDTHRITGTERQGRAMLMSHKAFEIYMGHADEDGDFTRDEAADGQGFEPTLVMSDCAEPMASRESGWLHRIVSSISERTQLPRSARG